METAPPRKGNPFETVLKEIAKMISLIDKEQAAERALAGVETYVENQVSRAVAEAAVRVQPHLCVATEQVS